MGGVVTKRECEGCWKVLVLIWYWLPRCVYLVKTRWAVLIWWTDSSVCVLCFIQALWKLLRFDIALFHSYDGCDSNARVWRSVCTFFPSVASSFLSDCTPAEVHMCACACAHTWAHARARTHTHTQVLQSLTVMIHLQPVSTTDQTCFQLSFAKTHTMEAFPVLCKRNLLQKFKWLHISDP